MNHKLSIIVPVYNIENVIGEAIESLLNQEPYNFEIILVDDGSTDRSGIICDEYYRKKPDIIKVIHKINGGLPSARKEGMNVVEGDYVSFLDGDDWCEPDYYLNMMREVQRHGVDIVCSGFTYVFKDKRFEYIGPVEEGIYAENDLLQLKRSLLYRTPYYTYGIYPSLCMKVVKTELMKKYIYQVPNNITLGEDAACSYPMLFNANRIGILNRNTGYNYRQNQNSMTHLYDSQKMQKIITMLEYMDNAFKPLYKIYGEQLDMYFTQLIKDGINNEAGLRQEFVRKKKNLKLLHDRDCVMRTLKNIHNIPMAYKIYFKLFQRERYRTLTVLINIKSKITNKSIQE